MKMKKNNWSAAHPGIVHSTIAAIGVMLLPLAAASPASAETRGYVVSWFALANSPDAASHCSVLTRTDAGGGAGSEVPRRKDTALLDGKPVAALNYPDLVVQDPNIETYGGKDAYGFDLGGHGENRFIDPETKEVVDNQVWRAVGCLQSFQATPPALPYSETAPWGTMLDSSPAFAIQISGDDLSKDGPVTITLDRTLRHLERDAAGGIRSGVSYVLDPSPRSHNVLSGEIKDGVLSVKSGSIYLVGDMPFYPQIDLSNAHMRIHSEQGGKLVGYWGGYADWHAWVYTFTARPGAGADSIGIYWALKKLADADPDPKTHENRKISMTWRLEAVPAFLATNADGKVVATASTEGLAGKIRQATTEKKTANAGGE
jgi:hypothetical protein